MRIAVQVSQLPDSTWVLTKDDVTWPILDSSPCVDPPTSLLPGYILWSRSDQHATMHFLYRQFLAKTEARDRNSIKPNPNHYPNVDTATKPAG